MATEPRYFDTQLYYHIYNCGVERRNVFMTARDYQRFLGTIDFYTHDQRLSYIQFQDLNEAAKQLYVQLNPKGLETLRVRLICYCLMPNHFHFVLKPAREDGITRFISDITNSYTRYFNIKNQRIGCLFQGTFKSKTIFFEESLLQVSRYVHLNPVESSKTNPDRTLRPESYSRSSYRDWIKPSFLNPKGLKLDYEEVGGLVKLAGGPIGYKKFVEAKLEKRSEAGIEDLIIEPTSPNP